MYTNMKRRSHKSRESYYVLLDKGRNTVEIYSTLAVLSREMGISRASLYRKIDNKDVYEDDVYVLWVDVNITRCNKGRDI